ncbi:MAG: hypothetical protein ACE5DR_01965 [Thermodesulfobacteriota bacterium]
MILILLTLCMSLPAAAQGGADTLGVKAYGSAVNTGNSVKAREAALSEALRDAVTSAAKDYLELHGIEADERSMVSGVYSKAESFVLHYTILSERWISEVREEPGTEAPEEGPGTETSPGVIPPDVSAEPLPVGPPTYHVLINATLDMDSLKRAILHVMGADKAMDLKVVMLDISDYETFTGLMATLRGVTIIEDLSYRSFKRDRFVLNARSVMDPVSLAGEIGRVVGADFVVAAYGIDTIIIKAFPISVSQ